MKHKLRFSPPAVGGASLLVSIAVLCLTVFALLSLTSAQTEERLAKQTLEAVTGYYQADARAEELLARLKNGEIPPEVTENNGFYTYSCVISQNQTLQVAVTHENGRWNILQWRAEAVLPMEEADGPLQVWDGTFTEEETP